MENKDKIQVIDLFNLLSTEPDKAPRKIIFKGTTFTRYKSDSGNDLYHSYADINEDFLFKDYLVSLNDFVDIVAEPEIPKHLITIKDEDQNLNNLYLLNEIDKINKILSTQTTRIMKQGDKINELVERVNKLSKQTQVKDEIEGFND